MSQDYPTENSVKEKLGYNKAPPDPYLDFSPWKEEALRAALKNNIRFFELSLAPRIIIQGECYPANQSSEPSTDVSMRIAAIASSLVSTSTKIERFFAFDDTLEANLVDYPSYLEHLKINSQMPDQIFFYSSPLLRELSADIFKHLLRASRSCPRFQIIRQGEKIFCQIIGKNIAIELVSSTKRPFPLDGLLFDTAVSVFKRYHHVLIPFYASLHMLPEQTDINRAMLDYYILTDTQSRNGRFFSTAPYLNLPDFDALWKSPDKTPYLDAIHNPALPPLPRSVVLNVTTKDNVAIQAKLNQILEFLGEDPTHSIYFDSSGNIEVECSHIIGPRLEERKRVRGSFDIV